MGLSYEWSHWEYDTFFKKIDCCVIGSGIVGLSAAIHFKKRFPNKHVVILERGILPIGASTRNAGFACFGSMTELLADLEHMEEEEVWSLVTKRYEGLQYLQSLLGEKNIAYEEVGGYELFSPEEEALFQKCKSQLDGFNKQLASLTGRSDTFKVDNARLNEFGFQKVQNLIINQVEGCLDTGRMMQGLLQKAQGMGVLILNGLEVSEYQESGNTVQIRLHNDWTLAAEQLVIATNGFAKQLLPDFSVKPARNQVMITNPIDNLKVRGCFHYDQGYYYFRNVGDRLLFGGARNLAPEEETTPNFGTNEQIRQHLIDFLEAVILPGQAFEIDRWWTGILGVGPKKYPIIKRVSDRTTAAVRLGGMGVAIGALVGKEAIDLLAS